MENNSNRLPVLGIVPIIIYPLGSFILGTTLLSFLPLSLFAPIGAAAAVLIGLNFHRDRACTELSEGKITVAAMDWLDWYRCALPMIGAISFFTFLVGCALAAVLSEFKFFGG